MGQAAGADGHWGPPGATVQVLVPGSQPYSTGPFSSGSPRRWVFCSSHIPGLKGYPTGRADTAHYHLSSHSMPLQNPANLLREGDLFQRSRPSLTG